MCMWETVPENASYIQVYNRSFLKMYTYSLSQFRSLSLEIKLNT